MEERQGSRRMAGPSRRTMGETVQYASSRRRTRSRWISRPMIALDANVLVRYLVNDHPQQADATGNLMAELRPARRDFIFRGVTVSERNELRDDARAAGALDPPPSDWSTPSHSAAPKRPVRIDSDRLCLICGRRGEIALSDRQDHHDLSGDEDRAGRKPDGIGARSVPTGRSGVFWTQWLDSPTIAP